MCAVRNVRNLQTQPEPEEQILSKFQIEPEDNPYSVLPYFGPILR